MTTRLAGKKCVITGGGGGIGSAAGKLFCDEGAEVVLLDLDEDALAEAATNIISDSPNANVTTIAASIVLEDDATKAMQEAADRMGGLDVLVNNAGIRKFTHLTEATPESWQDIISVNLLGTANCAKAAMPFLRESDKGAIVNVSSVYGVIGRKNMGQYDATKAAINSMTRTLAHEEAEHGVRVNCVCPGGTLTPFHKARFAADGMDQADIDAIQADATLMKRWAEVEEIAYPILWLASDEASFITGTILMADGGKSAK
ncbi:MAG: short-chain dehydrogenase [Rhodospirillaceae bacterium]|mgnify:CR=1 FL=1|nr:short-chain dehydrogenase [Rhodospirillaceae bacterium]|tara:strand:- start:11054 stop:11830 length:777 start_codon:yes stop_codon:yes gene_type:complete